MLHFFQLLAVLSLGATAFAHMQLSYPAPFRSKFSPVQQTNIDYSMTAPLSGAAQFPCKGYHVDLGTPAGASVATWQTGGAYNFTVAGSAVHGGGSCQVALSYDKGVSFKVIHSYIGSCPLNDGQSFDFTIPSDAKVANDVVFAWTWYNEIGNREIYQNCAAVTIAAGGSAAASKSAYDSRPDIFVANLANGCTTVETKDVIFPNPGPDVTVKAKATSDSGSFTGTCQAVKGIGGEAGTAPADSPAGGVSGGSASQGSSAAPLVGSSSPSTSTVAVAAASIAAKHSSSGGAVTLTIIPSSSIAAYPSAQNSNAPNSQSTFATAASSLTSSHPSSAAPLNIPSSVPTGSGGLTVSQDGQCSGQHTCDGSPHGSCCSQWGWCGSTEAHCGLACQPDFGQCSDSVNTSVQVKNVQTTSAANCMTKRAPRQFNA